ncbi:MAG: diaminopimelate epimerase [Planctomycetota bacterium]
MPATILSATENRFAVLDVFRAAPPADLEEMARRTCARGDRGLDGLLLLAPPVHGGDCRMVLYNPDGSRPEACGNGLRCIAKLAVERGYTAGDSLVIETDAGLRAARVHRESGVVRRATVDMGVPRLLAQDVRLATVRGPQLVDLVDMGNPHCVLFVADATETPVEELGPEIEKHGRFPARTNVDFVAVRPDGLAVRFWERGVGETASCGSGAAAAAAAAIARRRATSPVLVRTAGGTLRVQWDGRGLLRLEGAVSEVEGEISLDGEG